MSLTNTIHKVQSQNAKQQAARYRVDYRGKVKLNLDRVDGWHIQTGKSTTTSSVVRVGTTTKTRLQVWIVRDNRRNIWVGGPSPPHLSVKGRGSGSRNNEYEEIGQAIMGGYAKRGRCGAVCHGQKSSATSHAKR
jgi:hypothetical protein